MSRVHFRALRDTLIFLATNHIPRAAFTHFMGWFSRLEQPWVRAPALYLWRRFGGLDLSDARKTRFVSIHDCFIRQLQPGARPFVADADVLASPCDTIVGACGEVANGVLIQAKGLTYTLDDLLCEEALAAGFRDGSYATLRITPNMYHRFHAPCDATIERVTYVSGDTWNVNPATLARVDRLFCRNERAIVRARCADGALIVLVPVAAILVASMRFTFVDVRLHLRYRGLNEIPCRTAVRRGQELGWFEHGSTIIVLAPRGYRLAPGVASGMRLKAGQALMRRGGG